MLLATDFSAFEEESHSGVTVRIGDWSAVNLDLDSMFTITALLIGAYHALGLSTLPPLPTLPLIQPACTTLPSGHTLIALPPNRL